MSKIIAVTLFVVIAALAACPVPDPAGGAAAVLTPGPPPEPGMPFPGETLACLEEFLSLWNVNRQDEMRELCSPAWKETVENPKVAFFGLLRNRTLKSYVLENASLAEDGSWFMSVLALFDKNNGKDPVEERMNIRLTCEGGRWYVDPATLDRVPE